MIKILSLKRYSFLLVLFTYSVTTVYTLAAEKPYTVHLKKVTSQINNTKKFLHKQQQQYISLQKQLKKVELQQAKTAKQSEKTKTILNKTKMELVATHKKQLASLHQLRSQLSILNKQLRAYYKLGQLSGLKLFLNENNMQKSNQLLHYYHYLNQSRAEALTRINKALDNLHKAQVSSEKKQHQLEQLEQQQQQVLHELTRKQQRRHKILVQLEKIITGKQQKLHHLETDKRQLEAALKKLSKLKGSSTTHFANLRGHLHWPASGHIKKLYKKPIAKSELTWNGELITAHAGQKVTAIASGKVIYSDWLRGFGLLIIIDHGSGYMSLYARNQTLYKKVGEAVSQHELIARVGKSGGFQETALYFEIRHNGHPLDPKQWCSKA